MTIINVMVDDQRLEFSSMPVVASEGVKETYVKFALSSDWSGFGATALFYRDDSPEDVYTSVLDGVGLAEVPYEITAAPGWIRFGLSGSDGTSVHTSEILKYKIVKGKYTSGQSSEPPAPGIYEQMLAIAGQMRDTLNAAVIDQNAIIHGLEVDMSALETEQDNYENVITGRINTLVANFAGSSRETVLYEGSDQTNIGSEIDLVSDPTVYDYLDIVLNDGLIGTIIGPTQNSQWRVTGETVKSTGASVTTYVIEGVLDAQSLCLRVSTACAIVDTGTASTRYDLEDGPLVDESLRRYCLKVIGRKLTDDAEVLDIRVGANGTVYQTAGTAVRSQITALTDSLTKKLTTPLTSGGNADYGVSGQILATDGTGNTEWVDNRGPSAEQVQTAVDEWLDDHPEATTTVQDNSLTYNKLVKGTLGYVTPQMYGAIGDGITDDSNALLECFTDAITNRKVVYIPNGLYICDNNVLDFTLTDDQFLCVVGDGPSSCIKRKDQTAGADWKILINIKTSSSATKNISSVEFHNLKLDGNARKQPLPETNFGFEHSATLRVIGNSASRIERVLVDNVVIDDNVADGLYFPGSGSAYIDDIFINNFVTYTRNRVRSDICFTGYPESIFITNCKVLSFEFEYNTSPDVPTNVYISNLECETMDVIGTMRLEAVNLTITKQCYLGRVLGNIADSYITISDRRIRIGNITFTNCEFHLIEIPAETEGGVPSVQALTIEYAGTTVCLRKCRFVIDGSAEAYTGYLIEAIIGTILCIDDCEFDNRAIGIHADRCEKITVKNCAVSTPSLLYLLSSSAYPVTAVFDNVLFLSEGRIGNIQLNSANVLFNNVTCMGIDSANVERQTSSWLTDAVIKGSRKIYIDEPLTNALVSGKTGGVFLGDTYINTNALENEPMEWVRTQTFYATKSSTGRYWLHLRAIPNNPVGATADRPTCILGQGFQYYDTDLGKVIYWNGSAWVDSTGVTV